MGNIEFFLGTEFNWLQHEDFNISVHIWQSVYTKFTNHRFSVHTANKIPNMTLYHSGFPIDSIPFVEALDQDLSHCKQVYQIILCCINWLLTCTCPDIALVSTFLASYRNYPHQQHYKTAICAIKYLTSTNEYGISFHSNPSSTIQAFNRFPHHHDK